MIKILAYILIVLFLGVTVLVSALKPEIHKPVRIDENIQKTQPQESEQIQVAWNTWHSNVLNKLMELARTSPDNQPEGTLNYIEFDVDSSGNIINIKIYSEPQQYSQAAKKHFSEFVRALSGDEVLKFPKDSQRKITHFKAALQKAEKTQFSRPEDFADYETINKQR